MHLARQFLAHAKAGPPDPEQYTLCRCCGPSPYRAEGQADKVLPGSFVDHELFVEPAAAELCRGCWAIMAGKPSKTDPPVRTMSVFVDRVDLVLETVDRARMRQLLLEPPAGHFVLSWATSKQKHHWLHAGLSRPSQYLIGSDAGTIEYLPARDRILVETVEALLEGPTGKPIISRAAILSGSYTAPQVQRYGVQRWAELEPIVVRYRGQLLLDLVCWCAEAGHEPQEAETVIEDVTSRVARLIYLVSEGSAMRRDDGKQFWGGVLQHRVERFCRLPLERFLSRMIGELQVSPTMTSTTAAIDLVRGLSPDETSEFEKALRERSHLAIALAYDLRKGDKAKYMDRLESEAEAATATEVTQCELF